MEEDRRPQAPKTSLTFKVNSKISSSVGKSIRGGSRGSARGGGSGGSARGGGSGGSARGGSSAGSGRGLSVGSRGSRGASSSSRGGSGRIGGLRQGNVTFAREPLARQRANQEAQVLQEEARLLHEAEQAKAAGLAVGVTPADLAQHTAAATGAVHEDPHAHARAAVMEEQRAMEAEEEEDEATLEELRAQARLRYRGSSPTIDYWKKMRRYLVNIGKMKWTDVYGDAEEQPDVVIMGASRPVDLHYLESVRRNNVQGVQKALKGGADILVNTEDGSCALHVAVEANAMDTLKFLLRLGKLTLSVQDCRGFTPLHIAVIATNTKMVYFLILAGSRLEIPDKLGKTVLHHAVFKGNVQIVKMLLYYGSNPNAVDCYGNTPLVVVMTVSPYTDVARTLLNTGAHMDAVDGTGLPLLSEAVLYCNTPVRLDSIRVLVTNGCAVNGREAVSGQTALHLAAMCDHAELAMVLLENGADITQTNSFGETALEVALVHRANNVLDLLEDMFSSPRTSLEMEGEGKGEGEGEGETEAEAIADAEGEGQAEAKKVKEAREDGAGERRLLERAVARHSLKHTESSRVFKLLADHREAQRRGSQLGRLPSLGSQESATSLAIASQRQRTNYRRSFGEGMMAVQSATDSMLTSVVHSEESSASSDDLQQPENDDTAFHSISSL